MGITLALCPILLLHVSGIMAMKVYKFEGTLNSSSKEMSFATMVTKIEEKLPHR